MSGNYRNYWRGIPVDRLPAHIIRAEYARLNAAIDAEKARISARQYENAENAALLARSTDASGEGIGECDACAWGDEDGEPIGEGGEYDA